MTGLVSFLLACMMGFSQMTMTFADGFLGKDQRTVALDTAEVQGILFEEIDGFFGRGRSAGRVTEIEALLTPLYTSLPKDAHGRLGHTTVRYALHRFFQEQHAWHLRGLEPAGDAWNQSSPTRVLTDQVPAYIQNLFEEHLGESGFGMHEVAVLAATLEHVVKTETISRVEVAYASLNAPVSGALDGRSLTELLELHEVIYLLSLGPEHVAKIPRVLRKMDVVYPGWRGTQLFLGDTHGNLAYSEQDQTNPFVAKRYAFTDVVHIVEHINDQFGHFQDFECKQTKDMLFEKELKHTGRIRLADFYAFNFDGDSRFSESKDFLRVLGALDESDPTEPRVIVTNYMYGKSNCFDSSSFYSVCCLDECAPLLQQLERKFATAAVDPTELADAVAQMSSPSVVAPRNLTAELVSRLHRIAAIHGGVVPLHGRLFQLFLHHSFPQECPHPHVAGTTRPMSAKEYINQTGKPLGVTHEELANYGSTVQRDSAAFDVEIVMPWNDDEELLVAQQSPVRPISGGISWLRGAVALSALGAVIRGFVQRISRASSLHSEWDAGKLSV